MSDTDYVYLDHAATTTVRDEVIEAMTRTMREVGNASSLHGPGRLARRYVEEAREQVAEAIGADPVEVIFTSGATEADNLAVKGGYLAMQTKDSARTGIITSPIEHPAVLDPIQWLAERGATINWVEVDQTGELPVAEIEAALAEPAKIALATAMWVNNEVGAVSDIPRIARVCRAAGVLFHTDAVQAVGRVAIDFAALGADSLALSAHKIGGPQGIGALVARRSFEPLPQSYGGGQERRLRSGTLPTAHIVGLGVAIELAEANRVREYERLAKLRALLIDRLHASVEGLELNGLDESAAPAILNVHIPGADADALLMLLDEKRIGVSTGSACNAGVAEPSRVLLAMTHDEQRSKSSIRISLGRTTTEDDIDRLIDALPHVAQTARRATGYRADRG